MPLRSPIAQHASSPEELRERLEAEREGLPYLVWRDEHDAQVIRALPDEPPRLTVGRRDGCDIRLAWDHKVSRLHAQLELVGDEWTIADDGLSHNGTHVGEERVRGQRRLRDGDLVLFGETVIAFCDPRADGSVMTQTAGSMQQGPRLTDGDRDVLAALCRPLLTSQYAAPASNADIAAELHLSIAAVKSRLHSLFERFGLEGLPQNQKRAALAAHALQSGLAGHG